MLDVLHWLPSSRRSNTKIICLVWQSLKGLVRCIYGVRDLSCTTLSALGFRALCPTQRGMHIILVPLTLLTTKQNRSFSMVIPQSLTLEWALFGAALILQGPLFLFMVT